MEPAVYRDAFGLNDTELGLIADLIPPGQMLIRKQDGSKKVRLNVDPFSYWMATNSAKDNILKNEYFAQYGIQEGLERLAEKYPRGMPGAKRNLTVVSTQPAIRTA